MPGAPLVDARCATPSRQPRPSRVQGCLGKSLHFLVLSNSKFCILTNHCILSLCLQSGSHEDQECNDFQAYCMAHKGRVTSDVSYNPADPPEASKYKKNTSVFIQQLVLSINVEMLRGLMFKKFYRVPTFLLKDADMMKCSALICNLEAILMFKPTNLTSVQAKLAVLEISFILYFGQHECACHS